MKVRHILVGAAAVLLAAGCTSKVKQAETSANGFLNAYLSNEYQKAAEFCSEDLKGEFLKATADFNTLEPQIRELLVAECDKYAVQVCGAVQINKSDTVEVNYRIFKKADSLSFEMGAINGTLQVVDGAVTKLGK